MFVWKQCVAPAGEEEWNSDGKSNRGSDGTNFSRYIYYEKKMSKTIADTSIKNKLLEKADLSKLDGLLYFESPLRKAYDESPRLNLRKLTTKDLPDPPQEISKGRLRQLTSIDILEIEDSDEETPQTHYDGTPKKTVNKAYKQTMKELRGIANKPIIIDLPKIPKPQMQRPKIKPNVSNRDFRCGNYPESTVQMQTSERKSARGIEITKNCLKPQGHLLSDKTLEIDLNKNKCVNESNIVKNNENEQTYDKYMSPEVFAFLSELGQCNPAQISERNQTVQIKAKKPDDELGLQNSIYKNPTPKVIKSNNTILEEILLDLEAMEEKPKFVSGDRSRSCKKKQKQILTYIERNDSQKSESIIDPENKRPIKIAYCKSCKSGKKIDNYRSQITQTQDIKSQSHYCTNNANKHQTHNILCSHEASNLPGLKNEKKKLKFGGKFQKRSQKAYGLEPIKECMSSFSLPDHTNSSLHSFCTRSDNEGGEVRGRNRSGRRDDPRRHTLSTGADGQYLPNMSGQGGPLSRTMDLELRQNQTWIFVLSENGKTMFKIPLQPNSMTEIFNICDSSISSGSDFSENENPDPVIVNDERIEDISQNKPEKQEQDPEILKLLGEEPSGSDSVFGSEGHLRGYPPPSNAMLFDDDPGIMSEVETSSTGFRRGGKQRSSLPVVRTPSKTLERPLEYQSGRLIMYSSSGLVFLQYRNETKRALLPNEITSIDTVKALFVRSFPKQLTMEYLDSPNVKIYIHDSSKDMFYELEDLRSHLREIRDRSVLRLFESADVSGGLPMAGIGIAGGVGHFEDPSYFSEPEFDSEYQHQHIHKSKKQKIT
ncbi:unnamed protein product [Ceutorhynchus assimilis]|uniref:Actin interacting protein 3-like C-terminal domain-containing protein n=1 Tax=Ceutorhynchus assimilis TaxID=467358 RepID=A0A9N9MQL5_9CUCU|nr:unnamed protein product [Ceutorhynchus assimilis]